jgi:hypothetical protein
LAATKPLTPRQLATSLLVAARAPQTDPLDAGADDSPWGRLRNDLENQAGGWVREFEYPTDPFQVAVDEALFFSNNERVQNDLLRDANDWLVGRLKATESDEELIRTLWIHVLTRQPDDEELATAQAWLSRDATERFDSIRSLTWALLAGPEARFNR